MMITIKDILFLIRQKIKYIIIFSILGGFVAYLATSLFIDPQYEAKGSLYVLNDTRREEGSTTSSELTTSQQLVKTYLAILSSDTTLQIVSDNLQELGYYFSVEDIRYLMNASAIEDTEAFYVTIKHSDPKIARTIVNAIIEVAPNEIIRVVEAGSVKVIDYAKEPTEAVYPIVKYVLIGMLVGMGLSIGVILLFNFFDTRIHNDLVLKQLFDIPVIGYVPHYDPTIDVNLNNYESERGENEYV